MIHRSRKPIRRGVSAQRSPGTIERVLLACGVLSSAFHVIANDVVAARLYKGYSRKSQTISELSALDAPSRRALVPLIIAHQGQVIAFGTGVWRSAQGNRALRVTGGLLIGSSLFGMVALLFPMTKRLSAVKVGEATPFSDRMHQILLGGMTPPLMFATMGFGAAALGRRFRLYSMLSLPALAAGGVLTWRDAARVAAGKPTPWMGAAERMAIGPFQLWLAVLAITLLRARPAAMRRRGE